MSGLEAVKKLGVFRLQDTQLPQKADLGLKQAD